MARDNDSLEYPSLSNSRLACWRFKLRTPRGGVIETERASTKGVDDARYQALKDYPPGTIVEWVRRTG